MSFLSAPVLLILFLFSIGVSVIYLMRKKREAWREERRRQVMQVQSTDTYRIARARLNARRMGRHLGRHEPDDPLQVMFGVDVPTEFKPQKHGRNKFN